MLGVPVRFSLSFITRETGFGHSRQLMCSEVLEGPFLPQKEIFIILQVQESCKSEYRDFLYLAICLDWSEDLSRKFNLETKGNFLWVHHLRKFILAKGSFSSWVGSLHVYFPCSRILFSEFRPMELGLYGSKAGSMFWNLGKNPYLLT